MQISLTVRALVLVVPVPFMLMARFPSVVG